MSKTPNDANENPFTPDFTPNEPPPPRLPYGWMSAFPERKHREDQNAACRTNPTGATGLTPISAAIENGVFAAQLASDALAPRYREGDLLTFNTAAKPYPGDAVFCRLHAPYRGAPALDGYICLLLSNDGNDGDGAGAYNNHRQYPRSAFDLIAAIVEVRPAK